MADLGMNFDASQVEPNTGPQAPLPTDWYNVMITDSEMKKTKSGNGGYLELTLKVLDGPYANRQAWDRLNLYNPNAVAVEIAQKTLSAICHAVGVFQVQDSQMLHGKPLMARIVERPPEGQYDATNEVKGYAKVGERESKNAQGIKQEPNVSGATPTPAMPQGSPAPSFTPPEPRAQPSLPPQEEAPSSAPPWAR